MEQTSLSDNNARGSAQVIGGCSPSQHSSTTEWSLVSGRSYAGDYCANCTPRRTACASGLGQAAQLREPDIPDASELKRKLQAYVNVVHKQHARKQDHLLRAHAKTSRCRHEKEHLMSVVRNSLSELVGSLNNVLSQIHRPDLLISIQRMYGDFIDNIDMLLQHECVLREAEKELSHTEYQVATKQAQLVTSWLQKLENCLDLSNLEHSSDADSEGQVHDEDESVQLPWPVIRLQEKLGDVVIAEERIEDLKVDHKEARIERDSKKCQQSAPSISSEDFENFYESKRRAMIHDLEVCKQDAAELRHECVAQNLHDDLLLVEAANSVHSHRDTTGRLSERSERREEARAPSESICCWLEDIETKTEEQDMSVGHSESNVATTQSLKGANGHSIWSKLAWSFWGYSSGNDPKDPGTPKAAE